MRILTGSVNQVLYYIKVSAADERQAGVHNCPRYYSSIGAPTHVFGISATKSKRQAATTKVGCKARLLANLIKNKIKR